jgi:hypothetical protein
MSRVRVPSPAFDDGFFCADRATVHLRENEPSAEYHGDPAYLSKSQIADFIKFGPQWFHDRHVARITPSPQSKSLAYGTLVHKWAEFGDEAFWERVRLAPPELVTATGAFSKKADSWLAEQDPDSIPLTEVDRDSLKAQTTELLRNPAARHLLEDTIAREFSVRWEWHGHKVRCRPDAVTEEIWWDLKTTRDPRPLETWWRSVQDYLYAHQAALYQEGAKALGWPAFRMVFVVTSTVPPYACHCVTLPDVMVTRARIALLEALEEIQERRTLGHWSPDDYGHITELWVPGYLKEEKYV